MPQEPINTITVRPINAPQLVHMAGIGVAPLGNHGDPVVFTNSGRPIVPALLGGIPNGVR